MILRSYIWRSTSLLRKTTWTVLLVVAMGTSSALGDATNPRVVVWDTGSVLAGTRDVSDHTGWKAVPPDLLKLEADPAKASSDPGYYGREYAFTGDAVIENDFVTVVFESSKGTVTVGSRSDPSREVVRFIPLQTRMKPTSIERCAILQNTGDEAALEVSFAAAGTGGELSAVFSLDKTQIIEIRPAGNMKGISLSSPIEYGIVPSFIGDDLVFSPEAYSSAGPLPRTAGGREARPGDDMAQGTAANAASIEWRGPGQTPYRLH